MTKALKDGITVSHDERQLGLSWHNPGYAMNLKQLVTDLASGLKYIHGENGQESNELPEMRNPNAKFTFHLASYGIRKLDAEAYNEILLNSREQPFF